MPLLSFAQRSLFPLFNFFIFFFLQISFLFDFLHVHLYVITYHNKSFLIKMTVFLNSKDQYSFFFFMPSHPRKFVDHILRRFFMMRCLLRSFSARQMPERERKRFFCVCVWYCTSVNHRDFVREREREIERVPFSFRPLARSFFLPVHRSVHRESYV